MDYEALESRPSGSSHTQHGFITTKGEYIYTNSVKHFGFLFSRRQISSIDLHRLVLACHLVLY